MRRGLPQARNFGWQQARYDVVLYIDDDICVTPNFVRLHFDALLGTGAELVAGGIDEEVTPVTQQRSGSLNWWTATPIGKFGAQTPGPCVHIKGRNFSVRKSDLRTARGFDEALAEGAVLYEELELALGLRRLGGRAWFEPRVRLTRLAAPTGGCRALDDWPPCMYGLSHNRSILMFRHLRPWHRPTAVLRLLLLGVSCCRADRSLRPLFATLRGLDAGRRRAARLPLNTSLQARECTSC
jgi:glycosyltransferase involved in cell wall biosynthesis